MQRNTAFLLFKRLHSLNILDFIWIWTIHLKKFWTVVGLRPSLKNKSGTGSQNLTVRSSLTRGVQDPDFRTRVRQDSAHFEQTGSGQDYGFIQVSGSGSGFSNFMILGFDANTIIKRIFAKI